MDNRPEEGLERRILPIRGQRVILDMDLAALYGVKTKHLNEAVKRNWRRECGRSKSGCAAMIRCSGRSLTISGG